MKVIFLDMDGVLCSHRTALYIDCYAATFLINFCRKYDIKVVISSTWRYQEDTYILFKRLFGDQLHKDWKTTILSRKEVNAGEHTRRGREIQKWLDNHDVEQYAIIDDDSDFLEHQMENWIKIDNVNGMLLEDQTKISEHFGIKQALMFIQDDDIICPPNITYFDSKSWNF